jgi:hypothetical protein
MDNSMITIIGNTKVQIPRYGYLLTDGKVYSLGIFLPLDAQEWDEVINNGQLDEIRPTDETTVPPRISQLQGKLQLDLMQLYLTVEQMIAQSGSQAKIYWNTAANWERDSPILNNLAPIIWPEDTDEKLDQFFIDASKLN